MSSARYKRLLTNLPSMAAIVNAFESQEVQLSVFNTLMDALEESGGLSGTEVRTARRSPSASSTDVEHELLEGDSIHSIAGDD